MYLNGKDRVVVWVFSLGAFALGCDPDAVGGDCPAGQHACACVEGVCLTGLECRGGVCVDPSALNTDQNRESMSPRDSMNFTDPDAGPNPDAFWEQDPPPMVCNEDGTRGAPAEVPGGTPECPDDKNREGCACPEEMVGQTAPCWPGLRVNRNRGICMDGVTTCQRLGEFITQWGECEGAILPVEGVELGPESCGCFSRGKWELSNTSPCFITYPDGSLHAVSTFETGDGISCPTDIDASSPPPKPEPGKVFSQNTLTVDCEGQFKLCYTIKAGDFDSPEANDCVLAETCTEAWYEERDLPQQLPPLPSWQGSSSLCATQFQTRGGYGEMSVVGLSHECEEIGSANAPVVFNRVKYCPASCRENPSAPECQNCGNGGSGTF